MRRAMGAIRRNVVQRQGSASVWSGVTITDSQLARPQAPMLFPIAVEAYRCLSASPRVASTPQPAPKALANVRSSWIPGRGGVN
jgi:hypothetical protein